MKLKISINSNYFNKNNLVLLFLIIAKISFAQDTLFFDKHWELSEKSNAEYYRIYTFDNNKKNSGLARDYNITGELQMIGKLSFIDKTNFKNDTSNGTFTWYYKNGNKESEVNFINNKENGLKTFWFENQKIKIIKSYINGSLDGENIYYYPSGKIKRKEIYSNNTRKTGICYDELGEEIPFFEYEIIPEFPKGMKGLFKYFRKNVKYPIEALIKKVEGRVFVSFIVDSTGKVTDPFIYKSSNEIFNKESLRVVSQMPNWKPGKNDNKPCNVKFTVPINFKMLKF